MEAHGCRFGSGKRFDNITRIETANLRLGRRAHVLVLRGLDSLPPTEGVIVKACALDVERGLGIRGVYVDSFVSEAKTRGDYC